VPFNRDSTSYILIFVAVMVGVVSISLAFVSSALQPTIKDNEVLDKKIQILSSVITGEKFTKEFVNSQYESKVEELLVDKDGKAITIDADNQPFTVALNFNKEIRKPEAERRYPVFKFNADSAVYYILPLEGQGLWDRIWGYVSIESDFNTIHGSSFGHKGETPGLGAIITESWFQDQFKNKEINDVTGKYALDVLKGQGNDLAKTDANKVDGISGATITSQGVNVMLAKGFGNYKPFFETESENK
jgi:Na+-transporting NADH:ubiquinone oxidoreductase subunit C